MMKLDELNVNERLDEIALATPSAEGRNAIHAARLNHPFSSGDRSNDFYGAYAATIGQPEVRAIHRQWLLDNAWRLRTDRSVLQRDSI